MGKKDYTRYAKRQEEKVAFEPVENDIVKKAEEDYEKAATVEFEEVTKAEPTSGIVTDCLKLNIRKEPNPNSRIVCAIDCLTEVVIDEEESTDEFYKICTVSGVEGFCMKKFITIQ